MIKVKHKEYKIKGAKVAVYPMRDVEAVSVYASFNAGAWHESSRSWGAFHLLEHLTVNGTQKYPTRFAVEDYKETHAISTNAWTSQSDLGYWLEFSKEKLVEALGLLCEFMFKPVYEQSDLKRELSIIRQEYTDTWSDPYQRFWQATQNQFHGVGHPYSRHAIGQLEYLQTVSLSQLRKLHDEYFQNKNLQIAVVGKIDPDKVFRLLERQLPNKTGKKQLIAFPKLNPQAHYLYHKEDVEQVMLQLTWPLPGRNETKLIDRQRINIGVHLLGGSGRSRLYRRLRLELGLVYSVYSTVIWNPTLGSFCIITSTDRKKAAEVKKIIIEVVNDFLENNIHQAEFDRAQNYLKMRRYLSYDSVDSVAGILNNHLQIYNRVISPDEFNKSASKIKKQEVSEIMKKYLQNTKPFISVMSKKDPNLA